MGGGSGSQSSTSATRKDTINTPRRSTVCSATSGRSGRSVGSGGAHRFRKSLDTISSETSLKKLNRKSMRDSLIASMQ